MKIAYLNSKASSKLEYEEPDSNLNPMEMLLQKDKNIMIAVINHPDTLFFSLIQFAKAFNNEEISDMGYIAVCDDNRNLIFI